MVSHRAFITVAVVALILAGTAALHAQPAGGGEAADFFDRLDANNDGKIDRDEFRGPDEAFARLDRNADGFITRDELAGQGAGQGAQARGERAGRAAEGAQGDPAERWQQMLQRFDRNNDGQISADEFGGREEFFLRLDVNRDNVITADEAMQVMNRRGGEGAQGAEGARGDAGARIRQLLENADADGDGNISRDEWPGRAEMFDRLDRDGDGLLTGAELTLQPAGGAEQAPAVERQQRLDAAATFIRLMDSDGDGQVSEEEWGNFFEAADVNADGMISHPELLGKLQEALRPDRGQRPAEEPPAPAEGQ
ncbi:MAG: EF-hand domain-containing protein [Armatimonadota bacterium]